MLLAQDGRMASSFLDDPLGCFAKCRSTSIASFNHQLTLAAQASREPVICQAVGWPMPRKDPGPRSMVRFIGRVITGSEPAKHPGFVEPALATLRTKPPTGSEYVHEIKFDGYRVQAHLRGGGLPILYTRRGLNW